MKYDLNLPGQKSVIQSAKTWKRFVAFLIDLLILDFVIVGSFKSILLKLSGVQSSNISTLFKTPANLEALVTLFVFLSFFCLLYFSLLEYVLGQTIGKMLMNLHTVDDNHQKPKLWQCIVRSIFIIPIAPFYFLWVLDPIFMFFSAKKQRLTEYLTKTHTIERQLI